MSRSFKKTPIAKDYDSGFKRIANKVFRRDKTIAPKGKQYRKYGINQYRIHDYVFYKDRPKGKDESWDKYFLRK